MKDTGIQWCDSTLNLQMGCRGCELWTGNVRRCYAGNLTARYAGSKGWPDRFEEPKVFLERLGPAERWPDLKGTARPDKPWLDGRPRMVFLNDMGDTFSEGMEVDWLAPVLHRLAASPHVWLMLTKRPARMVEFSERHPLPPNVWPGVSVTAPANVGRILELADVVGGGVRWVSAEPMIGLDAHHFRECIDRGRFGWIILGGESSQAEEGRPFRLDHAMRIVDAVRAEGVPAFVKQLGSTPTYPSVLREMRTLKLADHHGGDWDEWPEALKVREVPNVA